ncbi:MAG: hypothetical protein IJ864_00985 [Alphaproteobacteria bacterium]|nr:hypothetical protein [Alphaproteobacteria bacterium]
MVNNKFHKLKYKLLATVGTLALTFGVLSHDQYVLDKQPQQDSLPSICTPIKTVIFQNDTLYRGTSVLLYYTNGKIVRNYIENSNSFRLQLTYIAHEDWHGHNAKSLYRSKYFYSPLEYRKLCMHDEITANAVAISLIDLELQTADNKDAVIKKYENTPYVKFYLDAIKKGEIDPYDTSVAARQKKHRFIADGTLAMWENLFMVTYNATQNKMLQNYLNLVGFSKSHPNNYNYILSHMYTFGGIDHSKLLSRDIQYSDPLVLVADQISNVNSLTRDKEFSHILVDDYFKHFPLLNSLSLDAQDIAFQHLFIAAKLKYELSKLKAPSAKKNPLLVTTIYNRVLYELSHDATFTSFVNHCSRLGKPFKLEENTPNLSRTTYFMPNILSSEDMQVLCKFYNYEQGNLAKLINHFDIHNVPVQSSYMPLFSHEYQNIPAVEADTIPTPLILDHHAAINVINRTDAAAPALQPLKPRRLSGDNYILIPNFEDNILVDQAMTAKNFAAIKKLFEDFEAIPTVWRGTNLALQQQDIEANGDPHYFRSLQNPFKPNYQTKKISPDLRKKTQQR